MQTAFCILAVDFHVFPRSGAKTLTFGRSVMDLGVGCVILAGALTSKARQPPPPSQPPGLEHAQEQARRTLARHAPLLALGAGRLLAVRATSYHEVHSEYGTHWNFFFTLGLASVLTPWLEPASTGGRAAAACALLALHQAGLLGGLTEYVTDPSVPRASLLSANREGLASLAGYVAMAIAGGACAPLLPRASAECMLMTRGEAVWDMAPLASLAAGLWLAAGAADTWLEPTSRRLCNAAYVLWVLAQGLSAIVLGCVREALVAPATDGRTGPPLLDAVNRHPLGVFMFANVLTGAANLTLDTMAVSHALAVAILTLYMLLVCAVALALEAPGRWATDAHLTE